MKSTIIFIFIWVFVMLGCGMKEESLNKKGLELINKNKFKNLIKR